MDQRQPLWGSESPDRDHRIFGSKSWSTVDKDEYYRLSDLVDDAHDERRDIITALQEKNRGQYMREWSKADKDEVKRADAIPQRANAAMSRFYKEMDEKYEIVKAKKKSVAEDATKSFVFEKLKYAPPRLGMPGGPGYEEAKSSFGKGRTRRRHRKSRRTRKH
jgi:hypothetical protein